MKRLFTLLLLMPHLLLGQTESVGNFPSPVRTVHYQSGTTPLGAFPIWTTRGVYYYQISTDTLNIYKQASLNETVDNKLLWVKSNGDVSAWIPDYVRAVDTILMLSGYQRKASVRRTETYLGTTDGSGNYTVTYSQAFSTTPDIQPQLQAGTSSQVVRITSSTTTGFTVQVTERSSVNLLGVEVLLAATTPVSGSSVGVLVISR